MQHYLFLVLPEISIHLAFNSMCSQSQVDKSVSSTFHVILKKTPENIVHFLSMSYFRVQKPILTNRLYYVPDSKRRTNSRTGFPNLTTLLFFRFP